METLRIKAKELLENKSVQVIIGYGEGTAKQVRAVFIRDPEKTNTLILMSVVRKTSRYIFRSPKLKSSENQAL